MSERHLLVGTWRIGVEIPGSPAGMINLATLSLDGGVIVAFPSPTPAAPGAGHQLEYWTPALGRWESSGSRSATEPNGDRIAIRSGFGHCRQSLAHQNLVLAMR